MPGTKLPFLTPPVRGQYRLGASRPSPRRFPRSGLFPAPRRKVCAPRRGQSPLLTTHFMTRAEETSVSGTNLRPCFETMSTVLCLHKPRCKLSDRERTTRTFPSRHHGALASLNNSRLLGLRSWSESQVLKMPHDSSTRSSSRYHLTAQHRSPRSPYRSSHVSYGSYLVSGLAPCLRLAREARPPGISYLEVSPSTVALPCVCSSH